MRFPEVPDAHGMRPDQATFYQKLLRCKHTDSTIGVLPGTVALVSVASRREHDSVTGRRQIRLVVAAGPGCPPVSATRFRFRRNTATRANDAGHVRCGAARHSSQRIRVELESVRAVTWTMTEAARRINSVLDSTKVRLRLAGSSPAALL